MGFKHVEVLPLPAVARSMVGNLSLDPNLAKYVENTSDIGSTQRS
jgi:hypothetical protein